MFPKKKNPPVIDKEVPSIELHVPTTVLAEEKEENVHPHHLRQAKGDRLIDDLILFDDVSKVYPNERGVHNVSFAISKGEFVFVTGSTGSGKTTLMKLLLKEFPTNEGSIYVSGDDISEIKSADYRRNIGMAFQDMSLINDFTAEENIASSLKMLYFPKKEINKRVDELLELFELEYTRKRFPHELSGGEKSRLSLARAVAHKPPVILVDEPTGQLDPLTALHVMKTLNKVSMTGVTVICVTHDKGIVDLLRKRVLVLRDGKLVSDAFQGYKLR